MSLKLSPATLRTLPLYACYLAPEGGEIRLQEEIERYAKGSFQRFGRLFICLDKIPHPYWAQNSWLQPKIEKIPSIQQAVKHLRSIQKNWALWPVNSFRRSQLIQDLLPKSHHHPLIFPSSVPFQKIGSWCLLDDETLLYSASCSSPQPNGEWPFAQAEPYHSTLPPSHAYLKLWEACSLLQKHPQPSERCLELGASPGSWTWALSRLGTHVTAVDRAGLSSNIDQLPGVTFFRGDAFQYTTARMGKVDWIFSDLICYPEKLLEFLLPWVHSGACRYFICTLKFQGKPNQEVIDQFAAIPGSQIFHLFHNKNELTWALGFPPMHT